jgi:hypothetical protein
MANKLLIQNVFQNESAEVGFELIFAGLWRFPRLLGSVQIVGGVRRALEIL